VIKEVEKEYVGGGVLLGISYQYRRLIILDLMKQT
jgi:hypothetical protein